jgi:hypothetical protein
MGKDPCRICFTKVMKMCLIRDIAVIAGVDVCEESAVYAKKRKFEISLIVL